MPTIKRWTFRAEGQAYTVPVNPNAMTSLFPTRAITARTTTAGAVLLFEGARQPAPWSFSGDILNAAHYEALRHWVYDIKQRVVISDHWGRDIECVLSSFAPVPKRALGKYWRHTYEISGTVLRVGAPTVFDSDPTTPSTEEKSVLVVPFTQAALTWTVTHNFTHRPLVETYDSQGHQMFASVQHTTDTQVVVTFSAPTTGYAVLV